MCRTSSTFFISSIGSFSVRLCLKFSLKEMSRAHKLLHNALDCGSVERGEKELKHENSCLGQNGNLRTFKMFSLFFKL